MTLLTCDQVRDQLPDALAGTLGADRAQAVLAHVAECADCRAEAELVRTLRRQTPAVPPGLEERIRQAVAVRRAPWLARGSRPALLAAGVAAAVLGGAVLLHRIATPPAGAPAVTAGAPAAAAPAPARPESAGSGESAVAAAPAANAPDVRGLALPLPGSGEGLFASSGNGGDLSEDELRTLLEELQS